MIMRISRAALGILFMILGSAITHAQGITGEISGTVTDATGSVVPDASLVVRNTETNEERSATTNSAGTYLITSLIPGTYRVQVTKAGFTVELINDLQLFVKQTRQVDVILRPGRATESVTVSAAAVSLDTQNAAQEQVLTSSAVSTLPLKGGNYVALTHLSPGAVPITGQVNEASGVNGQTGGRLNTSVSIGGNREQDMTYTYDGVESKGYWLGAVALFPPQDAISEFKVQQGYLSPEFGPPVVVNLILKSGDNSFHGTAFEYFRN